MDRFDEQAESLFPLETRPDRGGADAYVLTHGDEPVYWIGPVAGIEREAAERWAEMFRRPHAATLRQADANACALLAPAQAGGELRDAEPYLVRNLDRGDLALWWRPNCCGYTTNLDEAGRYTREDAEALARSRNTDQAWPLSRAMALAKRVVRNEDTGNSAAPDEMQPLPALRTVPGDAAPVALGLAAKADAAFGRELRVYSDAPAPDALRERAIRAMAEAGGVPESVVRAAAGEEGIVKREVDAVERALRDEREAAYQRGRADAAKTREEATAGVLALVDGTVLRRNDGAQYVIPPTIDLPADAPDRVTVAILTGDIAGIVEAHRAREAFAEHVGACPQIHSFNGGCEFNPHGNPSASEECEEGQRLAAAIGGAR